MASVPRLSRHTGSALLGLQHPLGLVPHIQAPERLFLLGAPLSGPTRLQALMAGVGIDSYRSHCG